MVDGFFFSKSTKVGSIYLMFIMLLIFFMIRSENKTDTMMKKVLDEYLIYEILSVVEEIPEGNVATYGQIARLIGRENNSRLVGKVLSMAQHYGSYPCHRVVNHSGRLAPGWPEQKILLQYEGVGMKDDTHVDLKRYQWDC